MAHRQRCRAATFFATNGVMRFRFGAVLGVPDGTPPGRWGFRAPVRWSAGEGAPLPSVAVALWGTSSSSPWLSTCMAESSACVADRSSAVPGPNQLQTAMTHSRVIRNQTRIFFTTSHAGPQRVSAPWSPARHRVPGICCTRVRRVRQSLPVSGTQAKARRE